MRVLIPQGASDFHTRVHGEISLRNEPRPPHVDGRLFRWCLARARSLQIPSATTPSRRTARPDSASPAGSHRARWCAPGGASKRARSGATPTTAGRDTDGYPPSVVGAVRASVQRSRELLRERPAWLGVRATVRSVSAHPVDCRLRGSSRSPLWFPTWFLDATRISSRSSS